MPRVPVLVRRETVGLAPAQRFQLRKVIGHGGAAAVEVPAALVNVVGIQQVPVQVAEVAPGQLHAAIVVLSR